MADFTITAKSNGTPPAQTNGHAPPKFSLTLASKKPRYSPAPSNKAKRRHSMLEDDDGAHEVGAIHESEQISSFGKSPDDAPVTQEAPYTIPAIPNRNWREESQRKRQKSRLPGGAQPRSNGTITTEAPDVVQSSHKYGLTVIEPRGTESARNVASFPPPAFPPAVVANTPTTMEEQAMDALTGKRDSAFTVIAPPPSPPPLTEDEALRAAYTSAPPMATLEEYAATPVEGFGAAILRGYLKPGETLETTLGGRVKEQVNKRRPGLLGIGAKENGEGVELGVWGKGKEKGKGGKGRREEVSYNPLALRNRKTGEVVSEEVLRERLEEQEQRRMDEARTAESGWGKVEKRYKRDGDGGRQQERERERTRSPRRVDGKRKSEKKIKFYEEEDNVRPRRKEHGSERRRDERRKISGHKAEIFREERQRHERQGDDGYNYGDPDRRHRRHESSRRERSYA